MLADPRADAFVDNFAGQWLFLRNLDAAVPVQSVFPDFDDSAAPGVPPRDRALLREHRPRGSQRARSAARRLHVPERAAGAALRHSEREGQPLPARDARRRTAARGGLLGQGSILTVTSYPDRTSPVVRGKWILENLLGTPPPPPLPNVPPLKPTDAARRRAVDARSAWSSIAPTRSAPAATR